MTETIPSTAICAACGEQRGEHSGGVFLCPDTAIERNGHFHFTENSYVHG